MGKLFNFDDGKKKNNEDEEFCECPHCQIKDSFIESFLNISNDEEVEVLVSNLYDIAYSVGYQSSLEDDILSKAEILEELRKDEH